MGTPARGAFRQERRRGRPGRVVGGRGPGQAQPQALGQVTGQHPGPCHQAEGPGRQKRRRQGRRGAQQRGHGPGGPPAHSPRGVAGGHRRDPHPGAGRGGLPVLRRVRRCVRQARPPGCGRAVPARAAGRRRLRHRSRPPVPRHLPVGQRRGGRGRHDRRRGVAHRPVDSPSAVPGVGRRRAQLAARAGARPGRVGALARRPAAAGGRRRRAARRPGRLAGPRRRGSLDQPGRQDLDAGSGDGDRPAACGRPGAGAGPHRPRLPGRGGKGARRR